MDNQFPHHECEIAQSESATGKPFVKYWIHNNLVTVNGQKMSKSLGNFVTLKAAFKKFDPAVIRFFILQSHYRSTLDFSEEAVEASKTGLAKLRTTVARLHEALESGRRNSAFGSAVNELGPIRTAFTEAMDDDFNTPKGIATLFELVSIVNERLEPGKLPSEATVAEAVQIFDDFGARVLGIIPAGAPAAGSSDAATERGLVELILELRKEARATSQWRTADQIRKGLEALAIKVEDRKDGTTTWKKG